MNSFNKTFLPTKDSKNRNWFLIDCKDQKLGRLATTLVAILRGKVKPQYSPSIDTGDYIILLNADLIRFNPDAKQYIVSNPGRPGHALRIRNASECLPKFVIQQAVKGMLSETETKRLMRRLRIYNGPNHDHQAQNPIPMDLSNFSSNFHP